MKAEGLSVKVWVGRAFSALLILFMLMDSAMKITLDHRVVAATTRIGYPIASIRLLGIVGLTCTLLYALPQTSILGAILLTGYLGGAVASKVRIDDPLGSSVLFGVYFGILAWGGLFLQNDRLRKLIPFQR